MGWKDLMSKNSTKAWEEINNAPDPTKLRKKVVDGIDKTLAHIKSSKGEPLRGWITYKDAWARLQVKNGGNYLPLNGEAYAVVPKEHVEAFYLDIKKDVEKGEFDNILLGGATAQVGEKKTRKPRTEEQRQRASEAAKKRWANRGGGKKA